MRNDPPVRNPSARPRSFSGLAVILLLLGAACALLTLAWPRLDASLVYLPVDTALRGQQAGKPIAAIQFDALADQARRAWERYPHYRYREGLAELLHLQARHPDTADWRRRPLAGQAAQVSLEVVQAAPARPRSWWRVAELRAWLGWPREQVVRPLEMSILTGRVEPALLLPRLELGLQLLEDLEPATRDLLRDQAVLCWTLNARSLRTAVQAGRIQPASLRSLLADTRADVLQDLGIPVEAVVGEGAGLDQGL